MTLIGLKDWFKNQKIQYKLILINVLVILMALLPIVVVMFSYEFYAVRQATLQGIRVQAAIVSDNAAAAMAFGDATTATEALATLQASPDALRATLIQPNGNVLAQYRRKGVTAMPDEHAVNEHSAQEILTKNGFLLQTPILLKTQFVGTLVLEASLDSFSRRIWLYFGVICLMALISMALSLWLAIKLKESITRPLSQLMSIVHCVAVNNDYSVRPSIESADEIGDLSRAFRNMMSNLQKHDERMQDLAYFDNVTGLPNRHFFKERIEEVVSSALVSQTRCCLMFIDLDDFKIVNDTLGHHIGDSLLCEVGKRLSETMRSNDIVCRIGGDEFALILENVLDLQIPGILAKRVIKALSEPAELDGHQVRVGASIGISVCPDNASDTSTLLATADSAMYVVKAKMKNSYHLYGSES